MLSNTSIMSQTQKLMKCTSTSGAACFANYLHFKTWRPERTNTKPSQAALERRSNRLEGKTMSAEQFARTRQPFDFPVISKLPVGERKVPYKALVKGIEIDEFAKLRKNPRIQEPIKPGDKVAITVLLSMSEDKSQIYKGYCISTSHGTGYKGRFTIRNQTNGIFYEMTFPYWSPFIRVIEVLEANPSKRQKTKQAFWYRQYPADADEMKAI